MYGLKILWDGLNMIEHLYSIGKRMELLSRFAVYMLSLDLHCSCYGLFELATFSYKVSKMSRNPNSLGFSFVLDLWDGSS